VSLHKYFGEQGPQHGGYNLQWPGTLDGFPVIGGRNKPDLKQEELENIEEQRDFKSQMFNLWDPDQKREFDSVSDRIINGWYRLLKRSDHWDEANNHYRVWLEWYQVYGMIPPPK